MNNATQTIHAEQSATPFVGVIEDKLQAFWGSKNYKIYVVTLSCWRSMRKTERKYIRILGSDNEESRLKAAKRAVSESISFASGKNVKYGARLAHPVFDLGCNWTGEGQSPL
ncbi:MAG: hypothetical protein COA78_06880 [Blastopirellula sp.]|nr:MAG: hypothetical protein COA78_06880 [Blastopirellula sp.]